MFFLLRAVFWTAAVALFVPGGSHGTGHTGHTASIQILENLKVDAIHRLARVRTELNARGLRAP